MSVELKGSVLSGYVRWLHGAGLFDEVRAGVSAPVQALMDDPPLPTQWIVARESTLEIVESLARVRDVATVRRMSREAVVAGVLPLFRAIIEGVLRRTTGPEGMVRHLPGLLARPTRNMAIHLEARGPVSEIVFQSHDVLETRPSAEAWAGATEALLTLAGGEAAVDVLTVLPGSPTSEIRLGVSLRARPAA